MRTDTEADLKFQQEIQEETRQARELAEARHIIHGANVVLPPGHYHYPSGMHGRVWVNALELVTDPTRSWRILQGLLKVVPDTIKDNAGIIGGPVTGGALLAKEVAGLINGSRPQGVASARAVFFDAFPEGGIKPLRKFFKDMVADQNVILIDDTRRSGDTLAACAVRVAEAGGRLTAILLIMDVENHQKFLPVGIPVYRVDSYHPGEDYTKAKCPMCKAGKKITEF